MEFDAVLLPPRRAASIAQGLWPERTINDALDDCVAPLPGQDRADRRAGGKRRDHPPDVSRSWPPAPNALPSACARLGVGRDDVVSCQLPNWWEFTALHLACSRLGAVLNPLMPILRERELSFMLRHACSKVAVVPKRFRGFDYEAMFDGLARGAAGPAARRVVISGSGPNAFETLSSGACRGRCRRVAGTLIVPARTTSPTLIYTSGTTGEPKGVLHSANTLMSNIVAYCAGRLRAGRG
ncbi:AMP-binding protein [Cupriavidus basilensis]